MGIYRGPGGTGDATQDGASQAVITIQAKDAAIAAQAAAETSASNASTSETNAANSATAAAASATTAAGYVVPSQTGNNGKYLKTDGSATSWDALDISTADIAGTLPLANGGTGATTAATARTSLGVTATGVDTTYVYRANNLSDLASAATARTNLGLGTAALVADSTLVHTSGNETIAGTKTFSNDASISGLTVGKGGGAVASNSAVGYQALNSNTTGANNTAVGYQAAYTSTTNNNITAIGYQALNLNAQTFNTAVGTVAAAANTSGYITAFGASTLQNNTTGSENAGFGGYNNSVGTLRSNTTGSYNSAFGYGALQANTTASNNTAVGYQAGYSNTTGVNIASLGYQSAYANTTGNNLTAVGWKAGNSNTTGGENSAFGSESLQNNTTGSSNTAIGESALKTNTTASENVAVGYQAGYSNTVGTQNTFIGVNAGRASAVSGEARNVAVGYGAGYALTTGTYNTFVGPTSGQEITTGSRNTLIGNYSGNQGGLDIRTSSNYIVLSDGAGNPRAICNDTGRWAIGTANPNIRNSREKLISYNTTGEAFLSETSDASYAGWAHHSLDGGAGTHYCAYFENSSNTGVGQITHNGTNTSYTTSSDYRLKENVAPMTGALAKVKALKPCTYTWKETGVNSEGFIAHELAEVCPDAVTGEKDAVNADGSIKSQGIDTSYLVATLTAAIQELNAKVEAQALEIATLKGK